MLVHEFVRGIIQTAKRQRGKFKHGRKGSNKRLQNLAFSSSAYTTINMFYNLNQFIE
jgi:hypothetical protein